MFPLLLLALAGLAAVAGLAFVACYLVVVARMFREDEPGPAVAGLVCPPAAFVYGWVKARAWNIRPLMGVWTVAATASAVFSGLLLIAVVAADLDEAPDPGYPAAAPAYPTAPPPTTGYPTAAPASPKVCPYCNGRGGPEVYDLTRPGPYECWRCRGTGTVYE